MKPIRSVFLRLNNSVYFIWISIFLLAALNYVLDSNLTGNELTKLVGAKVWADPSYLKGDWYFSELNTSQIPFFVLIFPLVKYLSLLWVSIIGRIMVILLLTFPLAKISKRIGLKAITATIAIGIFIWLHQCLFVNEWIFGEFENKVIAYALVFFGIEFLLSKKYLWFAFVMGLAMSMHILVGGWAFLIVLTCLIFSGDIGISKTEWLKMLFIWGVGASFSLYVVAESLLEVASSFSHDPNWIYVMIRNPRHIYPPYFIRWSKTLYFLPFIFWSLFNIKKLFPGRKDLSFMANMTLWSMLFFVFGVLVSYFPFGVSYLKYDPFRIGSIYILLFGLLLSTSVFLKYISFPFLKWSLAILYCFIFVIVGMNFSDDLKTRLTAPVGFFDLRIPPEHIAYYDACQWIKHNVDLKEIILAPPSFFLTSLWTEHPIVVNFKQIPQSKERIHEWYIRLRDFNGGEDIKGRSWSASRKILQNYVNLSTDEYLDLTKKYKSSYILTMPNISHPFHVLFKNRYWVVYEVTR
jgi:hypothetical protein